MSPELKAHIASAAVLICDVRQSPEDVHRLIQSLCEQAQSEGEMAGLDKAQAMFQKHFGVLSLTRAVIV